MNLKKSPNELLFFDLYFIVDGKFTPKMPCFPLIFGGIARTIEGRICFSLILFHLIPELVFCKCKQKNSICQLKLPLIIS